MVHHAWISERRDNSFDSSSALPVPAPILPVQRQSGAIKTAGSSPEPVLLFLGTYRRFPHKPSPVPVSGAGARDRQGTKSRPARGHKNKRKNKESKKKCGGSGGKMREGGSSSREMFSSSIFVFFFPLSFFRCEWLQTHSCTCFQGRARFSFFFPFSLLLLSPSLTAIPTRAINMPERETIWKRVTAFALVILSSH